MEMVELPTSKKSIREKKTRVSNADMVLETQGGKVMEDHVISV